MKRLWVTVIAAMMMSTLAGCIVLPERHYGHFHDRGRGHYHYRHH